MGVSIHGDAYRVSDVINAIEAFVEKAGGLREGALEPEEFFYKAADEFGLVLDTHWVTVYNEYYEDYNPEYNFEAAVQRYYFPDMTYENTEDYHDKKFDLPRGTYFGGGASSYEYLSDNFQDEFGYEGKFNNDDEY